MSCPDCGTEISDSASACIRCGRPLNRESSDREQSSLRWLTSKRVQWGAVLVAVLLTATMAPSDRPTAIRIGNGFGTVLVALAFSSLALGWKRTTRGYIPLLALIISGPIKMITMSGDRPAAPRSVGSATPLSQSSKVTGRWVGVDQVRRYQFEISEDSAGNLLGSVEYIQSPGITERVPFTGSRLGADILIRLAQTTRATPWVLSGRLVDATTITGHWSVGDMVLTNVSLSRP